VVPLDGHFPDGQQKNTRLPGGPVRQHTESTAQQMLLQHALLQQLPFPLQVLSVF
jgi:hypothetical protein